MLTYNRSAATIQNISSNFQELDEIESVYHVIHNNTEQPQGKGSRVTKPVLKEGITENEQWLLKKYFHRSAPVVWTYGKGWQTLSKTISDEETLAYWRSPDHFIALRYAKETNEATLDLDFGGEFHNLEDINLISGVLEDIGLVGCVMTRSSHSGGYHLRFPLPEGRSTYAVARTVKYALAAAGLFEKAGHLELRPNLKSWTEKKPKGKKFYQDYEALRLPCQQGFAILGWDLSIEGDRLSEFRHRWEFAAAQQDMGTFDEAIAFYSDPANNPIKRCWNLGGRLAEIKREHGELLASEWGKRQTNTILLNLARRIRILEKTADEYDLAEKIKAAAISMNGYAKNSRHQHHIDQRCLDVARWAIRRGWYYYGDRQPANKLKPVGMTNEEKIQDAIRRIREGLEGLLSAGQYFRNKTELFKAIVKIAKASLSTITKYIREFWDICQQLINPEKAAILEATSEDGQISLKFNQDKDSSQSQSKNYRPPHTKRMMPSGDSGSLITLSTPLQRLEEQADQSTLEQPLTCHELLDWANPPKFYADFSKLVKHYFHHTGVTAPLDLDWRQIDQQLYRIELEHQRLDYPLPWEKVNLEINRLSLEEMWLYEQFLLSLQFLPILI